MATENIRKNVLITQNQEVIRYQCDECGRLEDTRNDQEPAPVGWLMLKVYDGKDVGIWHFCSKECVVRWTGRGVIH